MDNEIGIGRPTDFQINVVRRLKILESIADGMIGIGNGAFIQEGDFTPTWVGTTGAGAYTYVKQIGMYSRFSNLMLFWGHMRITAITTPPTGDMWIVTDLPVAASFSPASFFLPGAFTFQEISFINMLPNTIQMTLVGWNKSGNLAMFPLQVFDDATDSLLSATEFNAAAGAAEVMFSGIYRVAS